MSSDTETHHETAGDPTKRGSDVLLLVFVHGFKGDETTFVNFPERLQHMLSSGLPELTVQYKVFPPYETKGDLPEAVEKFADWLTTTTVERENESGGGSGSCRIILCGHSMGGLLIADTIREFGKSKLDGTPLWPNVIACIAFDTPYMGLHPFVFKNSADKAAEHFNAAKSVGSAIFGQFSKGSTTPAVPSRSAGAITAPPSTGGWAKWGTAAVAVGGALFAGAAAGGAYYKRQELGLGYGWVSDHLKYVGTLWDKNGSKKRIEALLELQEQGQILFRNYYSYIPPSPPNYLLSRTFIVLPSKEDPEASFFIPAENAKAPDELQAHTGMFDGSTNPGFYQLGLETARVMREATLKSRGELRGKETEAIEFPDDPGEERMS